MNDKDKRIADLEKELSCLKSATVHTMTLCDCGKNYRRTRDKVCLKCRIKELEEELAKQGYIIDQFGEWYSDNGCPASETKEGFCPDIDGYRAEHEKRNLKEAEEDRFDFDSSDCETKMNCGKCYAAYYAKQWEEKQIHLPSPTPEKDGEQ